MQITTQDGVKQLGTIMGIWAHPDDETWASAGLMAMAHANGQRTCCVTATYGEAGVQDEARWPADKLAEIRRHELADACSVLGIDCQYYLGCTDCHCTNDKSAKMIEKIRGHIMQEKPDTIVTFGPTGSTGHPDHIAVSTWTSQAVSQLPDDQRPTIYHSVHSKQWYEGSGKKLDAQFNIFFRTNKPPLVDEDLTDIGLRLSKKWCNVKLTALHAHASQSSLLFEHANAADLHDLACFEGFMRAQ
ncbi:PIG-L family deacetylase [Candidatus Saccharibacteria bacterium]|nr:PIG-L family deacetylase [Candidatus Saccharibacteria bacterium]